MNNKLKKRLKFEEEVNRDIKLKKKLLLLGCFILFIACIFGTARGSTRSVFAILIDSPIKGLPYLLIVFVGVFMFYLIFFIYYSFKEKKLKSTKR